MIAGDVARAKAYKPWEVEYMQWHEIISRERQDGESHLPFDEYDGHAVNLCKQQPV